MHRCELTNEHLQAEIVMWRNICNDTGRAGPNTRQNAGHLADALQELLDRRVDANSEFRLVEASMAYEHACGVIDGACAPCTTDDERDWYDIAEYFKLATIDMRDVVAYLNRRALLDLHPEHPSWISIRDEDAPRAEGPLDPCPEAA